MARRPDPETVPGHTDRLLVALVAIAGATFVAVALWLLLGSR